MTAGAALMVQPRAIVATPGDVVGRKALPAASAPRSEPRAGKAVVTPPAASLDERVRRALSKGPLRVSEFLRASGLDVRAARELVASGVIVATGVTNGRRYALPGHPAKEAP
jgi:hypothetical protein